MLRRYLLIERSVAETPIVAGNSTRLLHNGAVTFAAIFDAIRHARNYIDLEYYTFEDVESGGEYIGDLLLTKHAAGVAVSLIYDSYGSGRTPPAFFNHLKQGGIKVTEFAPLNPFKATRDYSINDRDHRKIAIVDGTIAIIGGVNLSKSYQSRVPGDEAPIAGSPLRWRDTDLEIRGPAVRNLETLFLQHWAEQKGPTPGTHGFITSQQPVGTEFVRIIGSTPDNPVARYYVTILSAIRCAKKNIWLSAGYFVPTHEEKEELMDAARRGVDVRLLLPEQSDSAMALNVGHSHYSDLLEAGVKIYEVQNQILHSKTITIDGVWLVIGSSNFDQRSVLFNDEVDAVVLGSSSAHALEAMFEADQMAAKRIDPETWPDRPLLQKIEEIYARFWETQL